MTHYLLLKMKPGFADEKLYALAEETFGSLQKEFDCIKSAAVFRNAVDRQSNADILVIMEMSSREALSVYLDSPTHQRFVSATKDHVETRISIDCN